MMIANYVVKMNNPPRRSLCTKTLSSNNCKELYLIEEGYKAGYKKAITDSIDEIEIIRKEIVNGIMIKFNVALTLNRLERELLAIKEPRIVPEIKPFSIEKMNRCKCGSIIAWQELKCMECNIKDFEEAGKCNKK